LNEECVGTGKRARKNRKIDSDKKEIDEVLKKLDDVREDLRIVQAGITEAENNIKVGVSAYKF
jgi:peptidoglycan hydrolase CwlO-like protein